MSTAQERPVRREFTDGPLYRFALVCYGLLAATVSFLVACTPFIAAMIMTRLLPLLIIAGFSVGPAWVALLYTMRAYAADRDLAPVRTFWRGYRLGWRQALIVWAPYLTGLAILATDVAAGGAAWRIPLVIIGCLSLIWMSTVLVIISRYNFRTVDVLRLAIWGMIRSPRWTVAAAALLFVAGAASYMIGDGVVGCAAALFAFFTMINARGLFHRLDSFTARSSNG